MDSDDEFLSGLSSQDEDFGLTQDSDDGSLGDGTVMLLVPRPGVTALLTLEFSRFRRGGARSWIFTRQRLEADQESI